ncbi:MAG: glutamate-5-semialdehyde dehydrogenase [Candidatus Methylomirabilales bacterium]
MHEVEALARQAKEAARTMALLDTGTKDRALVGMAAGLRIHQTDIMAANVEDVRAAQAARKSPAFVDRLTLTSARIEQMARGIEAAAALADPVGEVTGMRRRPNGLWVGRMRVPLGVIAVIYESRPNVTADVAALCLKAGNAVLLRGGSEAIGSNRAIAQVLAQAAEKAGLPKGAVGIVATADREAVRTLLTLDHSIDLVIPRGGKGLVRLVKETATIPVIAHEQGICHVYVDEVVDPVMAEAIVVNAKTERPGVCNALETLLVHQTAAPTLLPPLAVRLREAGVELRGCPQTRRLVPEALAATEADWDAEYLDLILAVRVVESFEAALHHIHRHGSGLAEAIVTADHARAMRFLREVDAGAVLVNASTRFTDGYEFGMGAEIGISTQKLHARGPMGITELTCQKFIVLGDGQVRDSRRIPS